jgi:hypothetical protein
MGCEAAASTEIKSCAAANVTLENATEYILPEIAMVIGYPIVMISLSQT